MVVLHVIISGAENQPLDFSKQWKKNPKEPDLLSQCAQSSPSVPWTHLDCTTKVL